MGAIGIPDFQVKYKDTGYCAGGIMSVLMIYRILRKGFGDVEASKLQFFVKKIKWLFHQYYRYKGSEKSDWVKTRVYLYLPVHY